MLFLGVGILSAGNGFSKKTTYFFSRRRQKELTLSLEREASLDRSKAQLELDWQRRCEDAERIGYEKQEELVKTLTQGREEV